MVRHESFGGSPSERYGTPRSQNSDFGIYRPSCSGIGPTNSTRTIPPGGNGPMIPDEWLLKHAPGFRGLGEKERQAITDFTLAWSLFEAKALSNSASASAILTRCSAWAKVDKLRDEPFGEALQYFQGRYFSDGNPTRRYDHLQLRRNDQPALVARVLKGEPADSVARAAVPLIVGYRYRNNLFHGTKWVHGLEGQKTNLEVSTQMLMTAVDLTTD